MTTLSIIKLVIDILFMIIGTYLSIYLFRESINLISSFRKVQMMKKQQEKELLREICARVNSIMEGRKTLSQEQMKTLDRVLSRKDLTEEERTALNHISEASAGKKKQDEVVTK